MAIQRRELPFVPSGVDAAALAPNFKLYSDVEINSLKKLCNLQGRHRNFVDEHGRIQKLTHSIFNLENNVFVSLSGKELLLANNAYGRIKLAQIAESGEWVKEKVMMIEQSNSSGLTREEINNEIDILTITGQMVMSDSLKPVYFHQPVRRAASSDDAGAFQEGDGKYYLFMKYISGKNLGKWINHTPQLPLLVKMDIAMAAVRALMSLHDNNIVHRDIRPEKIMFDFFKPANEAVKITNFSTACKMDKLHDDLPAGCGTYGYEAPEVRKTASQITGKYSVHSDIYALGVTIGLLMNLFTISNKQVSAFDDMDDDMFAGNDAAAEVEYKPASGFAGDNELRSQLTRLINVMMHIDVEERPTLQEVFRGLGRMRDRLNDEARVISVCLLDIAALHEAVEKGGEHEQKFMDSLCVFNQIRMYDSTSVCSDAMILRDKQKLEARGYAVVGEVFLGTPAMLQRYIADYSAKRDVDGRIYKLSYIASTAALQQSAASSLHSEIAASQPERLIMIEEFLLEPEPVNDAARFSFYNWLDCLSWFFGALRDNISDLAAAHCRSPLSLCGFFSSGDMVERVRESAPLEEVVIDFGANTDTSQEFVMLSSGRY
jgi:serine/threonine protein kinase